MSTCGSDLGFVSGPRGDWPRSFGNRNYLRRPGQGRSRFLWDPDQGRPAAGLITLRRRP